MRIVKLSSKITVRQLSRDKQIFALEAVFEQELIQCKSEDEMDELTKEYHQVIEIMRNL